jgi:Mlc titration factor MtfA (ptsG expression regulator)
VHEKSWEGCNGLEMTDEIRVTIAAQAALLLIAIQHDYYANIESVLVYPSSYVARERINQPGMVVTDVATGRLGEAWRGDWPVVFSWPDALAGGRNESDGRNVVLHEFAHKLDFRDGAGDGVPRLGSRDEYERWSRVMSAAYQELVVQSANGHATLLNHYGATNPAEFFAVTTECFFERGRELLHDNPELYEAFKGYYRQDPAARVGAPYTIRRLV